MPSWALDLGLSHEALYRALARLTRSGRLMRREGVLRLVHQSAIQPVCFTGHIGFDNAIA